MFRNYAKTAIRHLLRHKLHSVINVVGLAVAMGSLILIGLLVAHEFSYDGFHEKLDSIYLTIDMTRLSDGSVRGGTTAQFGLGPALMESFPQIKSYTRLSWAGDAVVGFDNTYFAEDLRCVDSTFFEIFSFQLIAGNPHDVLDNPYSIVMTETTAEKYFGGDDPIGRVLDVTISDIKKPFTVTGISRDVPANSSLRFNMLIPIGGYPEYASKEANWDSKSCLTYLEIPSVSDARMIEAESLQFVYAKRCPDCEFTYASEYSSWIALMNLRDCYLNLDDRFSFFGSGSIERLYILSGIAFLILAIAAINFTTLSIGKAAGRIGEIGTRKAIGATRRQLAVQFMAEAVILSMIALLLGIALAEILLPVLSNLAGSDIESDILGNPLTIISVVAAGFAVGIVSGIYPALVLSGFRPSRALKGESSLANRGTVTRVLVLLQFSLSIFLIICAAVISRQMTFIDNRDLGIEEEYLVSIPTYTGWGPEGDRVLSIYKSALKSNPHVVSVTGVNYSFARGYDQIGWPSGGVNRSARSYRVDPDFIRTVGATIKEGRDFSPEMISDAIQAVLVNEALVAEFELQSPVGSPLDGWGTLVMNEDNDPTIIGVVQNFHSSSLHRKIEPAVIYLNPQKPIFSILVRVKPGEIREAVSSIEAQWRSLFPEKPFDYSFVDEDIARQYRRDLLWQKVVTYAAVVAVVTACLGLFGLASLSTVKRTKEIGVRKVLGASVPGILSLLSREFVIIVVISNVLAWPAAYVAVREWLSGFEYRTEIEVGVFVLSAGVALGIAILSVSYHAYRTSIKNPTDSLRYE